MKRVLFFVSLCVSITLLASICAAQENVPLRTKLHDDYARLVFGWPVSVKYSVDQPSDNQVKLTFEGAGALDKDGADISSLGIVKSINVSSQDPLTVDLVFLENSKIRHFKIGKRVILDAYFPAGYEASPAKEMSSKQTVPPAKGKPEPEPKHKKSAVAEPVIKEEVKQDKTHKKDTIHDAPTEEKLQKPTEFLAEVPPAYVLVPEHIEAEKKKEERRVEQKKKELSAALKKAIEERHHVISLRGTQGLSMATYVSNNNLWMVVAGGNAFSQPSLLSPEPELFSEMQMVQTGVFDVYRLGLPDKEMPMKVIGGELAWDIVIGEKISTAEPILPRRVINSIDGVRGGSVIWPLRTIGEIVEIDEPETGKRLIAVTVKNSAQLSGVEQSYVDFDVLKSPVGMVIRPKVDDLIVTQTEEGIEISRPSPGLSLSLPKDIEAKGLFKTTTGERMNARKMDAIIKNLLFKFDEWQLGDAGQLRRFEMVLLSGLHGQSDDRLVQGLLKLGKLFLSHGRGAEALGYFDYAISVMPALGASAEFRALRGAAKTMDSKYEEALSDLLFKGLSNKEEINYWKSYVFANLGDWQQAAEVLPVEYDILFTYPDNISMHLALVLAEVNLRAGQLDQAETIMAYISSKEQFLSEPMAAALKYLQGEASRQKGEIDNTKAIWEELTKDKDDLYRTKAGLALTMLLSKEGELDNEQTIDHLERLRYSWRGDGLEAQINYWLGDAYFKAKKFIKGLTIMRDAATIAKGTVLADRIAADMSRTFNDMFMGPELDNVSALDAVSVYDQFKELTPVDDRGNKLVQRLAEHLVKADLLGRAAKLLRHQVEHRLKGEEKLRVAIRLAAIELLDKNPQKALNALVRASQTINESPDKQSKKKRQHEIDLLKIRAYSQNKEYNKALSLVDKVHMDKFVNRLKADIAWKAGYWDVASKALEEVLIDEEISAGDELNLEQVDMIFNLSIALNLDEDLIALANIRKKYSAQMLAAEKDKARQFELITRKRRSSVLDNREALMSAVSEVDLFKDFLESYRNLEN